MTFQKLLFPIAYSYLCIRKILVVLMPKIRVIRKIMRIFALQFLIVSSLFFPVTLPLLGSISLNSFFLAALFCYTLYLELLEKEHFLLIIFQAINLITVYFFIYSYSKCGTFMLSCLFYKINV